MIKDYKKDTPILNNAYQAELYQTYIDPSFVFAILKKGDIPDIKPEKDELDVIEYEGMTVLTYKLKKRNDIIKELSQENKDSIIAENEKLIKYVDSLHKLSLIDSESATETKKQLKNIVYINSLPFFVIELTQKQETESPEEQQETTQQIIEEPLPPTKEELNNSSNKTRKKLGRDYIRSITGYTYDPILPTKEQVHVEWQKQLIESENRFVYVVGSRQMGKSYTLAQLALENSFLPEYNSLVCSFATEPTYRIRDYILKFMSKFNKDQTIFTHQKKEQYIENTISGSKIYFRTLADEAERVRGMTLDMIIIDEAAYVDNEIFDKVLRPTTITTLGRIISISSPAQRNWFYEHVMYAKKGELQDSLVLTVTYKDNPFIPKEEIKNIEYHLSKNNPIYKNEYCCEFLGTGSSLFQLEQDKTFPTISPHGFYVLSYDPARMNDQAALHLTYTYKGHSTGIHTEYIPEIHKETWQKQALYIKNIQDRTDCFLVVDATGVGSGVITILKMCGVRVDCAIQYTSGVGETISNEYQYGSTQHIKVGKARLIQNALTFIEEGQYSVYPYTNQPLIEECNDIEFAKKGGLIVMLEPRGYDDAANAMLTNLFYISANNLLTREKQVPRSLIPTIEDTIDTSYTSRIIQLSKMW